MTTSLYYRAYRLRQSLLKKLMLYCQGNEIWYQVPPPRYIAPSVQTALSMDKAARQSSPRPMQDMTPPSTQDLPSSREIFFVEGTPLPCWQESDVGLNDDWLTTPNYYPIYYWLFRKLTEARTRTRLLEIGVRTGYMGTVYAKAAQGASYYLGVDPDLVVLNGLSLAGDTFRRLQSKNSGFEYSLLKGYSSDLNIQKSLARSGPFDIIHIDGDHSLLGKLIDLELASRLVTRNGFVLVDDYDYLPTISEAVHRALSLGWFTNFSYIPTWRGMAILRI